MKGVRHYIKADMQDHRGQPTWMYVAGLDIGLNFHLLLKKWRAFYAWCDRNRKEGAD